MTLINADLRLSAWICDEKNGLVFLISVGSRQGEWQRSGQFVWGHQPRPT